MSQSYSSWGRYFMAEQEIRCPQWANDLNLATPRGKKLLTYGNGRSYGDSCLNDGGVLIDARQLDHFIHFDQNAGTLTCEAGVLFDEILKLIIPKGWFLPVMPGTRYITVGGAVANDIHGKNHHRAGSYGHYIKRFELQRSNGDSLICSPGKNAALFNATIGGLGLTGTLLWVEFELKKITNPLIDTESIRFDSLEEFFELCASSDDKFEYTVAWIDCLAEAQKLGRGIFIRGNHAPSSTCKADITAVKKHAVPIELPVSMVNPLTLKIFNSLYYSKHPHSPRHYISGYIPFFFPLDRIENWNRLYGRKGFFQYQCVVPAKDGKQAIYEILQRIAASGTGSFLSVLKKFGPKQSPGLLSFPREGLTLALDFANQGTKTLNLLQDLDSMVIEYDGAVYPAKDARMSSDSFKQFFPNWEDFLPYIDENFSSSFWRRVMGESE